MRSILCAYAGRSPPAPRRPLDVREVERLASPEGLGDRVLRAKALTEHLARLSLPPTRVVAEGGATRDGYGFALATFTAEEMSSIAHCGTVMRR